MADGSLTFDTKIDTQGFDKATKELTDKGEKSYKALEKTFNKTQKEMEKVVAQMDKTGAKLDELVAKTKSKYAGLPSNVNKLVSNELNKNNEYQKLLSQQDALNNKYQTLSQTSDNVKQQMSSVATAAGGATKNMGLAAKATKGLKTAFAGLGTTIKMLLKSFLIMQIILAVIAAIGEGMGNLRQESESLNVALTDVESAFEQTKNAIATGFAPIVEALAPALIELANALSWIFTQMAQLNTVLTTNNTTFMKAKNVTSDYTKALKKNNTESKKMMANFDEINKLSKQSSENAAASNQPMFEEVELDQFWQDWQLGAQLIEDKAVDIVGSIMYFFQTEIPEALRKTKKWFQEFSWDGVLDGIKGAWKQFWSDWRLGASVIWDWFTNTTVGQWFTKEKWLELWNKIKEGWNQYWEDWKTGTEVIKRWWDTYIGVWFTKEKWLEVWDKIKTSWDEYWTNFSEGIEIIKEWWDKNVAKWFTKEKWLEVWDNVKASWDQYWTDWKTGTDIIKQWFEENVKPWFTKEKWIEVMSGIKEGFKTTFTNAVNVAIGLFNKLIDWINSKMKFEWDSFEVAGQELVPAGSIQLFTIPKIPALATGTVVPANYGNFLAMLGDNTRETEVVSPLSTMKQALMEALAESGQNITIKFEETSIGDLVRLLKPYIDKENRRVGSSMRVGGAY